MSPQFFHWFSQVNLDKDDTDEDDQDDHDDNDDREHDDDDDDDYNLAIFRVCHTMYVCRLGTPKLETPSLDVVF